MQMDFNTQVVSHYRLLGYENHRIDDERFLDDAVVGEIGADHSVSPLYNLKLHDDADGPLGEVFVRYQEPDSNEVVGLSRTVTRGELSSEFEGFHWRRLVQRLQSLAGNGSALTIGAVQTPVHEVVTNPCRATNTGHGSPYRIQA